MTVTSVTFLLFLLLTAIVFYVIPVSHRWVVLLIASLIFYVLAGSLIFVPFILMTSFVIWLGAVLIGRSNTKLKEKLSASELDRSSKKNLKKKNQKKTRLVLVVCLLLCVGALCVTKFAPFAVRYMNMISEAIGADRKFNITWLIVPLGISYYTFSTVGYILDVYWKRYSYEKNFFRFLLYTIYFPHILQGPISRYNLLGQELKKELRFNSDWIVSGIQLMTWGFFKKLVIADRLNIFISNVYTGELQAGSIYIVTMIFDVIMIYTDFSGYVDIVRGVSQIFGVELEQNFNHPFFSKTVSEFWRRWHMSLGGWFKDYVYYPITVSRWAKNLNKRAKKVLSERWSRMIAVAIPCLITWFLTGLWHGTGETYVYWGIYYGILITFSVGFQTEFNAINKALKINTDTFVFRTFQMVRTFCIFMGGRLLTSPGSLHNTKIVIEGILTNFQIGKWFDKSLYNYGISSNERNLLIVCFVLLWAVSMMQERFSIRQKLSQQNIVIRWGIMYAALFAVIIYGMYGAGYDATSFVYMQY